MCYKTGSINTIEEPFRSKINNDEIKICERFIELYFVHRPYRTSKYYNREHTSYGLKHLVEHWAQACHKLGIDIGIVNRCYVSNEAFIQAMANAWYTSRPDYKGSPNLYFAYDYVGPRIFDGCMSTGRHFAYRVPFSEDDWEKVLNVKIRD